MVNDIVDDELREDAANILHDTLEWRLHPGRWAVVATRLGSLRRALGTGDVTALRAAVHELERLGPVRAVGFGEDPAAAPDEIRAEINDLIHTLDGRDAGD